MSDQPTPPPKPKPGSLRDRIAAFEKPSTASPAPPAPRPKPSGLSWKPKVPSPPSSPGSSDAAHEKRAGAMSASDAKESITKGGSLKERMAALQGRGGFGAPPPLAPKPALEKPKWRPPPVVAAPPPEDDGEQDEAAVGPAPPPAAAASPETEAVERADGDEQAPALDADDADPEEEERRRRAAIAARMARLGGARVGMGQPVFGVRPESKKSDPSPGSHDDEVKPVEDTESTTDRRFTISS